MRKVWKSIVSMVLAVGLVLTAVPYSVSAEETNQETENYNVEIAGQEKTENDIAEDEDPGAGRLKGDVPAAFYGGASLRATSGSYVHDSRFNGYQIDMGIDVSKWNGTINWTKVKNAGVEYVLIRAAYRTSESGTLNMDPKFADNIKGATAAGIPAGAYIFSQAVNTTEAKQEANYILNAIKGYKISLPVVFDFEFASNSDGEAGRLYRAKLTKAQATNVSMAFCDTVKAKGYTPMVYANKSMLTNHLNAAVISAKYPIWLAHYTTKTNYAGDYTYWQYTSKGKVNGISGNVDCNFRYQKKSNTPSNAGAVTKPVTVGKTTLSGKASAFDKIKLTWKKVSGASGYQIQRYNASKKAYTTVKTITKGSTLSYTNGSLNASSTYKYRIRAYKVSGGKKVYGAYSNAVSKKTKKAVSGKAKTNRLNVRKGPGTSYKSVAKLKKRQKVTVKGSSGSWYKVSFKVKKKTVSGYIRKDMLKL